MRLLPLFTGVAAALLVAIVAIRSAAIHALASSGPAAPFAFIRESEAGSDAVLQRLATGPLNSTSAPDVLSKAQVFAARYPLSVNAPFAIGMARSVAGERAAAVAAMRLTVQRNPRNRVVRTWLTDQALRSGDYTTALRQLSALMKIEPTLVPQISSAMVPFLFAPGMVNAFANEAESKPNWLPTFIDSARREPRLSAQVQRLMLLIAQHQPDAIEARNIAETVNTALDRGDGDRARQLLEAFYPTAFGNNGNLLFDPGFLGTNGSPPFAWSVNHGDEQIELGTSEGLQVAGVSTSGGRLISQSLVLTPQAYLLRTRASGEGLASYRWQIRCDGELSVVDVSVADVVRLSAADGGLPFTIGSECKGAQLSLLADGRGGPVAISYVAILQR